MKTSKPAVNDPNNNYAMYEADREAKRKAQSVTGEGDKRAKEMHKAILKEVRRLECVIALHQAWVKLAREIGTSEADKQMTENLNWKP